MAKQVTEKCKYKTKYAIDTWVTAAQYIAELVCENIASQQNTDLPIKFWSTDKWKNPFIYQASIASKLLKKYHPIDIIDALKSNRTFISLKNPILMDLLRKKAYSRKKLEAMRPEIENKDIAKPQISPPRPPQPKKSILDEL